MTVADYLDKTTFSKTEAESLFSEFWTYEKQKFLSDPHRFFKKNKKWQHLFSIKQLSDEILNSKISFGFKDSKSGNRQSVCIGDKTIAWPEEGSNDFILLDYDLNEMMRGTFGQIIKFMNGNANVAKKKKIVTAPVKPKQKEEAEEKSEISEAKTPELSEVEKAEAQKVLLEKKLEAMQKHESAKMDFLKRKDPVLAFVLESLTNAYDKTLNMDFDPKNIDIDFVKPIINNLTILQERYLKPLIANANGGYEKTKIIDAKNILKYVEQSIKSACEGMDPLAYGATIVPQIRDLFVSMFNYPSDFAK